MKKSKDYGKLLNNMLIEWKWLLRYVVKYKVVLVLYIVLGLMATGMSLGVSVATKYLIDTVVAHSDENLPKHIVVVVGLAVFHYLFTAVTSWITAGVSSKTNNEIREEIYSHIIKARWDQIKGFHSGDLLNRLETDVSVVSSAIISFIPGAFTKFIQFFGALAIVLYYDATMAFLALMSAPFLFFSSRFLIKTIRKFSKQTRKINGDILSYSEESVQNIQILKAFDLTKQYISNFSNLLQNYRNVKLSYDKFSIIMTLCLSLIGLVVSYSCYGWGIYRLWQGAITYGTMTLFLQISGTLTSSFGALASLAPTAVSIATSAGRIMEVTSFDEESDLDKDKAIRIMNNSAVTGISLNFDNICFYYDEKNPNILNDASFEIKSGETVGFIGPSGEGKTTIFKLILGLIEPVKGRIYIKGNNEECIDVSDSTRRFCSYVPQNLNIFSGTIRENLMLVKPDATEDDLINVLKSADLYSYISTLPKGLDTPVNEQGANFSQGQLQRLAIARALLRKSFILLMDEATSALDTETESKVLENIMISNPSRITIITTHRESMLKYCDRVFRVTAEGDVIKY